MNTKYIFVTGGVVSGLGKGITAASLGRLLKARGLSVTIQKFDPYINVDPGTMSPFQHGEVFVTDDGAETDLDIGHYERFIDENLNKYSNVTTGKIYQHVINMEREGKYLGETVQVIPHITNEIKRRIYRENDTKKTDIVITEIGGTIGDIESLPYIEAIRQVKTQLGQDNVLYIHVTLIPFIKSSEEIKTKPTQHSVKELMQSGIIPDIVVCRTSQHLQESHKKKIALFCNVPKDNVFENFDEPNIYGVPLMLEAQGLSDVVCRHFKLETAKIDLTNWTDLVCKQKNIAIQNDKVKIAIVGKYVSMKDAYISLTEALNHGGIYNDVNVDIDWISAEDLEDIEDISKYFQGVHGLIIPGGFGERGLEGKIEAIKYARENKIPYFGICLGMQLMSVEFARNVLQLEDANTIEVNENVKNPIITLMEEQKKNILKGGTMRLGAFDCDIKEGSLAHKLYGKTTISERHRHRYEFNNAYTDKMEKAGFIITGKLKNGNLVEIAEVKDHPYMIGVQFHPELKSRITNPHPLFVGFIEAAKKFRK
ncbi:CTP synthase [Brachyspira murdochii]|uniref:CTP synthase n=1 Tax=Brachyspira murdochii (strain ATCC 51284 / DSM 12563 / 56-150) TaxID=526224 RepID=D5U4R0_BRAM5|nr:CTP synthase [Brachyspira murdochii]ADG72314.1 CTP synthase [Brachyspira murdochii DSM 12563]